MVKPTAVFLVLWLQLDEGNATEMAGQPVSDLDRSFPEPYLQYQQHNPITEADVRRAAGSSLETVEGYRSGTRFLESPIDLNPPCSDVLLPRLFSYSDGH
jgi:hypothetical protein